MPRINLLQQPAAKHLHTCIRYKFQCIQTVTSHLSAVRNSRWTHINTDSTQTTTANYNVQNKTKSPLSVTFLRRDYNTKSLIRWQNTVLILTLMSCKESILIKLYVERIKHISLYCHSVLCLCILDRIQRHVIKDCLLMITQIACVVLETVSANLITQNNTMIRSILLSIE